MRCIVCASIGVCAVCGGTTFGIRRGGAEHVEGWAARSASVPVARPARPRLPRAAGEIVVGGAELVRDLGPGALDLVAVLDADAAARRPGLSARERALAIWMEAVGRARPAGRAIVQSSHPSDPAVQALVRGNPIGSSRASGSNAPPPGSRSAPPCSGSPAGDGVEAALAEHEPLTSLVTTLGDRTICLLALEAGRVPAFSRAMRDLAVEGVVERVEAEPHL